MKRTANVVLKDGRLMAEVVRSEACQQCHACHFGQQQQVYVDLPEGDYAVGDTVELELEDASFSKATLIAYALPVALLFIGLFTANAFTDADWALALGALAGLGAGLILIKLFGKRLEKLRPRVCEKQNDGGIMK